ncbi:MAG: YibE/F family protein [Candidatus Paceibacterota bacterium]
MKKYIIAIFLFFFFGSGVGLAAELHQDEQGVIQAEVKKVISEELKNIPGTDAPAFYQTIEVELLTGDAIGRRIILEDDFIKLEVGDKVFLRYLKTIDGDEIFSVAEPDRRGALVFFVGLFFLAIIVLAGWQGLRAIASLVGGFLVIYYVLFPLLLAGTSPVLLSSVTACLILTIAIYATHGFNREATAALLGTVITIVITGLLAAWAVSLTRLTGFSGDESVFLNFNTGGTLNFQGLLLAAIIIGVIGVLDDIAITQAATVAEMHSAAPHLTRRELYLRVLRIGREHVVALVNTLVFAYVGASLPLLLLFYLSVEPVGFILNRELFAGEIIRTVVGSISLIMTVPLTTVIAVFLLYGRPRSPAPKTNHHHHH